MFAFLKQDPMILTKASGTPFINLIFRWSVNKVVVNYYLKRRSKQILIEDVMGGFDGDPSTADLNLFFDIPVLAIIDSEYNLA